MSEKVSAKSQSSPVSEKEVPTVEEVKAILDEQDTTCPHCGSDTALPKYDITEEDKDLWCRHILSQGKYPFTATHSFYNGRVTCTLKNRNAIEDHDVDMGLEEVMKVIRNTVDLAKIRTELLKLQLVYSIDKLEYQDPDDVSKYVAQSWPRPTVEEIKASWAKGTSFCAQESIKLLERVPTAILVILSDKLVDLNIKCTQLTIKSLAEDFG